eukprot:NODE_277_length_11973_cov_0.221895.p13 type:complete len:104 gc:universal NODE_277_length_11973_cov_0.221895:6833-7144(+)
MEFELAAKKINPELNLQYFGVIYGVLRDYHILTQGNVVKVFVNEWIDISSGKIDLRLLKIDGPFSGDLASNIKIKDSDFNEMDRLVTFVHNNKCDYKGFGLNK